MKYKSQENAMFICLSQFIAIHPTTYRGGGFLTHGVLNVSKIALLNVSPSKSCVDANTYMS